MALGNASPSVGAGNGALTNTLWNATVLVTSLGYLVDMFDIFLFNMFRVASLTELGFSGADLTARGLFISNCQYAGIFLGAYAWGFLGDRIGRKKCLFGSILLYSVASIACAFVYDVNSYAVARFAAGFGLAGELGVGITLIAEKLNGRNRGYGSTIFISLGFVGVMLAAVAAQYMYWRDAYILGGVAGLALMVARGFLMESGMFENLPGTGVKRGGLGLIFGNPQMRRQFIGTILLLVPGVFGPQIVWTLSPELARSAGIADPVMPNIVLGVGFAGFILGDLIAIYISEKLQSRKKAALISLLAATAVLALYFIWTPQTPMQFYMLNGLFGCTLGMWVLGTVWAAEQFGTNIRATVATTAPNFARGATLVMNLAFASLKSYGALAAMGIIGAAVFALAYWGWRQLPETYGKDLDYYHE